MKKLLVLGLLAFSFVAPAEASAPSVNSRVAKLERQVKRLNAEMFNCLGEVLDVKIALDGTFKLANAHTSEHALVVINPDCIHG